MVMNMCVCVYVVRGSLQIEIFTARGGTVETKWIGWFGVGGWRGAMMGLSGGFGGRTGEFKGRMRNIC